MAIFTIPGRVRPVKLRDLREITHITPTHASILVLRRCVPGPDGTAVARKPLPFRCGRKPVLVTGAELVGTSRIRLAIVDPKTDKQLRSKTIECNPSDLPSWFTEDQTKAS